ncbi:MAG: triose-phosphate isomerase [Methanobacteriaceae archaeon]|nr:triose-phosphate isomerase [Methanobacteriaceae archaeon]
MSSNKPIVILNYKTYLESSGEKALLLAKDLESVYDETGIPMIASPQAIDISKIKDETSIPVYAQHIDPITPGGNTGSNLLESFIANGIDGTLLNHSEKRMKLADIESVVSQAKKANIISCVCSNNVATSEAVATLAPNYVAVEPPELIGTGIPVSKAEPEIVTGTVEKVKNINKNVKVLCGAGISTGEDMKAAIDLGAEGVLLASGIIKAKSPKQALLDLVSKI